MQIVKIRLYLPSCEVVAKWAFRFIFWNPYKILSTGGKFTCWQVCELSAEPLRCMVDENLFLRLDFPPVCCTYFIPLCFTILFLLSSLYQDCVYLLFSNTHIPIRPPKYFHFKKSIGNLLDYRNLYFVNLLLLYCIWRKALQKHWQLTIQASLLEHTIPSKLRSFKEYKFYVHIYLNEGLPSNQTDNTLYLT